MSTKTATIIGGTGLIGSHLWTLLQKDSYYDTIRLLVRRPLPHNNAKTEVKLIDFQDWESFKLGIWGSHAVFCAVGTTMKKVGGDKDAYRKIDYDIAVRAAQFCAETGCHNFLLVSSVGASASSNNFYLRLKGEIEEKVTSFAIPSISIFQPSMLLGSRTKKRLGEGLAQQAMKAFSFAIPDKYKAIQAEYVAQSMIAISKKNMPGVHYYLHADMMQAAQAVK